MIRAISLGTGLSVLVSLLTTVPALAHGDMNYAAVRQISRSLSTPIRVEGQLMGDSGTLRVQDRATGHSYVLTPSDDLRTLLQSGAKNVAVQGMLSDDGSIDVLKAERL